MKKHINFILAVLFLATAMSTASCEKEEPVVIPEKPQVNPELRISLEPKSTITAFKGVAYEVPFNVTYSNGNGLSVERKEASGAEVGVTLQNTSGVISILPTGEKGTVKVTFSNGLTSTTVQIDFDTYAIAVNNVPSSFGDGHEYTFSFNVETNLPFSEISVSADSWINASFNDGTVSVTLPENDSDVERKGSITIVESKGYINPIVIDIVQDCIFVNKPGMVPFTDRAFKNAVVAFADTDNDGEISPAEAEAVEEMVIVNKGIRDLSGLEYFKNVWKVDARDNDIEDADVLTNLRYLYWLDLGGNKNLRTFDVTGCTMYFEHCSFEVSDKLNYRQIERQIGVGAWCKDYHNDPDWYQKCYQGSDYMLEHATLVKDTRETTDWSRQNAITQVQTHTKGNGKNKFVVVGTGFIDEDLNNGTYTKIMNQAIDFLFTSSETMRNHKDYLDIYVMDRLTSQHNQWYGTQKEYNDNYQEYKSKYSIPFWNECFAIERKAFGEVTTGSEYDWQYEGSEYRVFILMINLGPHPASSHHEEYMYAAARPGIKQYPNTRISTLYLWLNTFRIGSVQDAEGKSWPNGYAAHNWHIQDFDLQGYEEGGSFKEFTDDLI